MRIEVFMLEWKQCGDSLVPKDNDLYKIAEEYAKTELSKPINFRDYKHVWVACEVDEDRKPVRARCLAALIFKPDLAVLRSTDQVALVKMIERVRGTLQDTYALRGMECFLFMPENHQPEQYCDDHEKWLDMFKARASERVAVTI